MEEQNRVLNFEVYLNGQQVPIKVKADDVILENDGTGIVGAKFKLGLATVAYFPPRVFCGYCVVGGV